MPPRPPPPPPPPLRYRAGGGTKKVFADIARAHMRSDPAVKSGSLSDTCNTGVVDPTAPFFFLFFLLLKKRRNTVNGRPCSQLMQRELGSEAALEAMVCSRQALSATRRQCTATLIFARLVKLWMWCFFQSCRSCFSESTVLKAVAFWLILALTRARRLCLATAPFAESFAFSLLHPPLYLARRGSGPVTKAFSILMSSVPRSSRDWLQWEDDDDDDVGLQF